MSFRCIEERGGGLKTWPARPRAVWRVLQAQRVAGLTGGPAGPAWGAASPSPLSRPLEQAAGVAAQLALSPGVKKDVRATEGPWKPLSPRPPAGAPASGRQGATAAQAEGWGTVRLPRLSASQQPRRAIRGGCVTHESRVPSTADRDGSPNTFS